MQSDAEIQSDDAEGTEKEQNAFVQDDSTSGDVSASDDTTDKGGFVQQDDSAVTPDAGTVSDSTDKDSVLNFVQSDAEIQSDDAEGTEKEQNAFVQDDSTSGDVSASDDTTEKGGFLQLIN